MNKGRFLLSLTSRYINQSRLKAVQTLFQPSVHQQFDKRFPGNDVDVFDLTDFTVTGNDVNLQEIIAKGSYGMVYKGTYKGQAVALKYQTLPEDEQELVNMLVELSLMQCHPCDRLVGFVGAGYRLDEHGAQVFTVMELCSYGTLRDCSMLSLPWALRVRLSLDTLLGIAFLHDKNILHRDIKTQNILVDSGWRAKLCDLQFACHRSSDTKQEYAYGTREFMSPEIALALDYDLPSDIFSFGVVLCEVITAKAPSSIFLNRTPQKRFELPEREVRDALLEHCPEGMEALAYMCCELEPSKRPDVAQCIEELETVIFDLGGHQFSLPSKDSFKIDTSSSKSSPDKNFLIDPGKIVNGKYDDSPNSYAYQRPQQNEQRSKPRREEVSNVNFSDWMEKILSLEGKINSLQDENKRLDRQLKALSAVSGTRGTQGSKTNVGSSSSNHRDECPFCEHHQQVIDDLMSRMNNVEKALDFHDISSSKASQSEYSNINGKNNVELPKNFKTNLLQLQEQVHIVRDRLDRVEYRNVSTSSSQLDSSSSLAQEPYTRSNISSANSLTSPLGTSRQSNFVDPSTTSPTSSLNNDLNNALGSFLNIIGKSSENSQKTRDIVESLDRSLISDRGDFNKQSEGLRNENLSQSEVFDRDDGHLRLFSSTQSIKSRTSSPSLTQRSFSSSSGVIPRSLRSPLTTHKILSHEKSAPVFSFSTASSMRGTASSSFSAAADQNERSNQVARQKAREAARERLGSPSAMRRINSDSGFGTLRDDDGDGVSVMGNSVASSTSRTSSAPRHRKGSDKEFWSPGRNHILMETNKNQFGTPLVHNPHLHSTVNIFHHEVHKPIREDTCRSPSSSPRQMSLSVLMSGKSK